MSNYFVVQKGLSAELKTSLQNGKRLLLRTDGKGTLPGQPRVQLQGIEFEDYVKKSHLVSELDKLAPYLSLIATPSSAHIYPLHEQLTRGRTVSVTEYPGLHLVWYYDKIFIKPIPPYLLSKAFWEYIREADEEVWKSVAGFIRTYYYLIQYETDFRIATSSEMRLISRDDNQPPITYEEFAVFIAQFQELDDQAVSPRYSYGALRLTRLNHLSRIFLRKWTYFHLHPQWGDFLGTLIAPIITLFAVLSTILNCMQVALTARGLGDEGSWRALTEASIWFSIAVMLLVAMLLLGGFVFVLLMFFKEQYFAWSIRRGLKLNRQRALSMKSAVI